MRIIRDCFTSLELHLQESVERNEIVYHADNDIGNETTISIEPTQTIGNPTHGQWAEKQMIMKIFPRAQLLIPGSKKGTHTR